MRTWTRVSAGLFGAALALATVSGAAAQTKMPSTLRYGSGLMDVPVASVLPHLAVVGTFSGFWTSNDTDFVTDDNGVPIAVEPFESGFNSDLSLAVGLFDRLEVGGTFQAFEDEANGGNLVGAFGRLSIVRPQDYGLGLAVGARYVPGPDYGDGIDRAPGRLGRADRRLRTTLGGEDIDTDFSFYAVADAELPGIDSEHLPRHDFTVTGGWGSGMFRDGDRLPWYGATDSNGWFGGVALHVELAEASLLTVMGEWNGFDLNVGAQVDVKGVRVGAHVLGVNYGIDQSIYRSTKFGLLGSVAFCVEQGGLCRPSLKDRVKPDTIQLPAPPPDTVVVTRVEAPPLPTGAPAQICLATGQPVEVLVTSRGDTLVGPSRVAIESLRPGVVFAGTYAEGRAWYEADEPIAFEKTPYARSGGMVRLNCDGITQVGEYMGVPLFVQRGAEKPYKMLYVPVRPGVWQGYEADLRKTT
ncbi:MAG: hypothetical protein D6701_07225, partial [Gemmatimonadetes bacterium]